MIRSNPKGDITESSGTNILSPRTTVVKKESIKKKVKKKVIKEESTQGDEENMENLKEQVMERAAKEGGMLEMIKRSQEIKKELGVSSPDNPVNVDKKMIQDRLQGVKKVIEETTTPEESNRF